MNYIKIYNNIINNAKAENRQKLKKTDNAYIYYEKHHILPKCLNGSNDKENLVLLNIKEHYICHKLLTFIFPDKPGILLALHRMLYGLKQQFRKKYISSRDYAYCKELLLKITGENTSMFGKHHSEKSKQQMKESRFKYLKGKGLSEETKKNLSIALTGKKYPIRKPMSDEQKIKLSIAHKNKKLSEEHKRKISEANSGVNHWCYGKIGTRKNAKLSEETKQKISYGNLGKNISLISRKKMSESHKGKIPWNKKISV
jgi:hypothetical protein